jgi:hypothetical protein
MDETIKKIHTITKAIITVLANSTIDIRAIICERVASLISMGLLGCICVYEGNVSKLDVGSCDGKVDSGRDEKVFDFINSQI